MVYDLPDGWQVADAPLTPNLSDPREILSVGTFSLSAGGDLCAHVPEGAMESLGPEDVLVSLQERSGNTGFSFVARPTLVRALLEGISQGDAFECIDARERADIRILLWLPFQDEDRGFYLLVVMATEVSDEVHQQTVTLLDSLEFGD